MFSFPEQPIVPEKIGKAFLQGDFGRIYRQTTNDFQRLAGYDEFQNMAQTFNNGVTVYNLLFSYDINNHLVQYVWSDDQNERALEVYMDGQYIIHGFAMHPIVIDAEGGKKYSQQQYDWPIQTGKGWTVAWGGDHPMANAHHPLPNQRHAYDLVIQTSGKTYKGSSVKNENYSAYGEPIYAPAKGEVALVVDGILDNRPGIMNEEEPAGNAVVIRHALREYSILAHLQYGSIQVREREQVLAGDLIGRCGNSGNSTEPHLHLQLSNRPDFLQGTSIRMRFKHSPDPIRGDQIDR